MVKNTQARVSGHMDNQGLFYLFVDIYIDDITA